jgi:predicted ATPase
VRAEAAIGLSIENHFPFWLVSARILRGWALAEEGRVAEGILQIRQGVSDWQAQGSVVGHHYFLALLADAYRKAGQAEEGLDVIAEALSTISDIGGLVEAELYRLKGELWLIRSVSGTEVEAEGCFQQAIEIARRQGAKSLELRAVTSLSRLWHRQGKSEAARRVLEEIYAGFSEGFETADLKEARALLEVLAPISSASNPANHSAVLPSHPRP